MRVDGREADDELRAVRRSDEDMVPGEESGRAVHATGRSPHFPHPAPRIRRRPCPCPRDTSRSRRRRAAPGPTHSPSDPPSCRPAGSANTSALFGAVDREADEDAHERLARDQARGEQHALAIALLDFVFRQALAEGARHEVVEQAAEEDRHHGLERQVDADGRGEHRHAERRLARLQDLVEDDDGDADHRRRSRSCPRAGRRRTCPSRPTP